MYGEKKENIIIFVSYRFTEVIESDQWEYPNKL
jgi:hypothetical protein